MSSDAISTPQSPKLLSLKRPRSKEGSNQCGKKSKRNTTCPICDETIKEPTKHRKGDDSIYCEGYCDAWIHRRCAGLSAATLAVLGEAGEDQTFFCLYCELQAHKAEIENLMSTITELQTCLFDLKRKLDATQQLQQTSKSQTSVPSNTTAKETHEILNQSMNNAERKFNVVVYGIPECPQKTNRQLRTKQDLENVIDAMSKADNEIESNDIKDLYRLGKYDHKSQRPRPLLIKFLRSNVALDILSSKNKLEAPVYIKPDLTPFERQKERLLLKERRSLIDNGTERRNIKMRNDSLYVNNKLHCKVSTDGNKLEFMSKSVQQTINAPTTSMESS